MPNAARTASIIALAFLFTPTARAQSVVAVDDLRFMDPAPDLQRAVWLNTIAGPSLIPRVTINGVEAYLGAPRGRSGFKHGKLLAADVALLMEADDRALTGTLYMPDRNARVMTAHPFEILGGDVVEHEERFRAAMASYYDALAGADLPGGPWFRRRAAAFGSDHSGASSWSRQRSYGTEDAFAMFTGGRALAENLRLDEVIRFEEEAGAEIDIADIDGITVPAIDFAELYQPEPPPMDELASAVPEDAFAVFFPSFDGLLRVVDDLQASAAPIAQLVDRRAEHSFVRERYERQLCVGLDGMARLLGSKFVTEAAFIGSDPYMRTGTDVALLMAGNVEAIRAMVAARQGAVAAELGVEIREIKVAGWDAMAIQTADRSISSWLVATDSMVVVAGGQELLRRVLETHDGVHPSLAQAAEYRWFRERYGREEGEDAFVVVSDAAIRKWSGPFWRIGTARRIKAAAQLADADAWRIATAAGVEAGERPEGTSIVGGGGEIELEGRFARDAVFGTRAFLTPVAELLMDSVSEAERDGYARWRRRFERAWGGAFDPIAARLDVREDGTHMDMTLVPLILSSDYRMLIELVGNQRLSETSPAPHPEALIHFTAALHREGSTFRSMVGGFPSRLLGDDGGLGWVGDHVSLYLDEDDAYFERIRETESADEFMEECLPGLPVGMRIDVDSQIGAIAFLTGMRSIVADAAPGLVDYSSTGHGGREYVTVALVQDLGVGEDLALHYVLLPGGLVLSPSRRVIERAIDRVGQERPTVDWSDRGVSLQVRGEVRELADVEWLGLATKDQLVARSWGNLAILNEWKRLGAEDPVLFHEQAWGSRLICPGGGEYVWDAEHGTMQSTVFGHPAAPKEGPLLPASLSALGAIDVGLSFERFTAPREDGRGRARTLQGLRAKVSLLR